MKRFLFLLAAVITLLAHQSRADAISDWNATAVSINAPLFDLAYLHIAIYDAVNAIDGRYTHFAVVPPNAASWASKEAATAAAARGVLLRFYPSRQVLIDSVYAARIALLPNDSTRSRGIAIGDSVAQSFLALRTNDGRGASVPYTFLPLAPGVYQLTPGSPPPPATPLIPWLAHLRPFAMKSVLQFRASDVPALTSSTYTQDFNEVKSYGSLDSSLTTPQQREAARFYTENATVQYARAIRDFAATQGLPLADNARLFAQLFVAMGDALIAGWDSKFYYNFWRPVTAIRNADIDGNPSTERDTSWLPLVVTPNHQEYISTHSALTGAMTRTLESFFGMQDITFTFTSTVTGTSHSFTNINQFVDEMANARVWGGIHFRTANVRGIEMGRNMGEWVAQIHFRLRSALPWVAQNSGLGTTTPVAEVRLDAVSNSVCWGIHGINSNRYIRTTDGGANWSVAVIPNAPSAWRCAGIEALDANTAWILMQDPSLATSGGVFKTTDGGVSWTHQSTAFTDSGGRPRMIHFFDANVGLCVGFPNGGNWEIYRTTNGGELWSQVPHAAIPPPLPGEITFYLKSAFGKSFWFSSSDVGLTTWGLYRTTDRGLTWTRRNPGGVVTFGSFRDSVNGIAERFVPSLHLLRTSDGGDTWIQDSTAPPAFQGFLTYVPGTRQAYVLSGFLTSGGGELGSAYSKDAAANWFIVDRTRQYGLASFASPYAGWSAGDSGVVYKWTGRLLEDSISTSVREITTIAEGFRLEQNYPNPFNPSTRIQFSIAPGNGRSGERVTLKVYNVLGREVQTLVNENLHAGSYEITFDASGLASGVYFYRLQVGEFTQTKRLLLLR